MQSITRKLLICVVWLTLSMVLCISGCAESKTAEENKKEDILMDAQEDLKTVGITLNELVDSAEGERTENGYGYYRFHVSEGHSEALKEELKAACGEPLEIGKDQIPGYMGHPIAKMLNEEELLGVWNKFANGQGGAKTRSISLYLTDNDGENYLYSFG